MTEPKFSNIILSSMSIANQYKWAKPSEQVDKATLKYICSFNIAACTGT